MASQQAGFDQPIIVGRVVYGTITLMTVLIIYDGWQELRFREVVGVIVGPVLAMFLSHVFAATLARQMALSRPLKGRERVRIVRTESRFLLLAAPPLLILGILTLFGASLNTSIRATVVLGAASLGYWGAVAGRRSGLTGRRLILAALAGLLVGAPILALQVFLQPGKAATGGVV